jgi:hypothetical protein
VQRAQRLSGAADRCQPGCVTAPRGFVERPIPGPTGQEGQQPGGFAGLEPQVVQPSCEPFERQHELAGDAAQERRVAKVTERRASPHDERFVEIAAGSVGDIGGDEPYVVDLGRLDRQGVAAVARFEHDAGRYQHAPQASREDLESFRSSSGRHAVPHDLFERGSVQHLTGPGEQRGQEQPLLPRSRQVLDALDGEGAEHAESDGRPVVSHWGGPYRPGPGTRARPAQAAPSIIGSRPRKETR